MKKTLCTIFALLSSVSLLFSMTGCGSADEPKGDLSSEVIFFETDSSQPVSPGSTANRPSANRSNTNRPSTNKSTTSKPAPTTSSKPVASKPAPGASSKPTACAHNYLETATIKAKALKEGEKMLKCQKCGAEQTKSIPATKTLKVLAIGNSFSVDGMEYLWQIAKSGGVKKVVLGNLYIGGCSLDQHYGNIIGETASYIYYKNTNGIWKGTPSTPAFKLH